MGEDAGQEGEIVKRAVRVRASRSSKSVQILLDSARHTSVSETTLNSHSIHLSLLRTFDDLLLPASSMSPQDKTQWKNVLEGAHQIRDGCVVGNLRIASLVLKLPSMGHAY